MAGDNHRAGGKIRGSHTTVIPTAAKIVDIANTEDSVDGIILGFIKSGLRSSRGGERVKIGFGDDAHVLLQVRGNTSQQEIRLFVNDAQKAKLAIAKGAREKDIAISFDKRGKNREGVADAY